LGSIIVVLGKTHPSTLDVRGHGAQHNGAESSFPLVATIVDLFGIQPNYRYGNQMTLRQPAVAWRSRPSMPLAGRRCQSLRNATVTNNKRIIHFSTQRQPDRASSFATTYAGLLKTYPISTKALTSGVIAGFGDAVCQILIERNKQHQYDIWRSARFGFLGMALVGPVCHYWYGFLARIIPSQQAMGVAKRVMLDQFLFAPLFLNCFCTSLWVLEGRQFESVTVYLEQIKETLPAVIATNWILWIPSMALNFRYVPVPYQVLASNMIATVWNVYLSFKTTKKQTTVQ
jgi:Mpv17 / PMP22 family